MLFSEYWLSLLPRGIFQIWMEYLALLDVVSLGVNGIEDSKYFQFKQMYQIDQWYNVDAFVEAYQAELEKAHRLVTPYWQSGLTDEQVMWARIDAHAQWS